MSSRWTSEAWHDSPQESWPRSIETRRRRRRVDWGLVALWTIAIVVPWSVLIATVWFLVEAWPW